MCWCLRSSEFRQLNPAGRKDNLEALIRKNIPVGIPGYHAGKPTGWCSVAPRETYQLLEHSTSLKRIDSLPVWSVACFFVAPFLRSSGFLVLLLRAAVAYARSQGATVIEGYPVELDRSYRFMGSPSLFEQAGFKQVAVTRNGRRVMRVVLDP